jgi:hypothetical protein
MAPMACGLHAQADFFPPSVLSDDLESIYAAHLLKWIRRSSFDAAVLLAHERGL